MYSVAPCRKGRFPLGAKSERKQQAASPDPVSCKRRVAQLYFRTQRTKRAKRYDSRIRGWLRWLRQPFRKIDIHQLAVPL